MEKHNEKDFILPTLFVIYECQGDCTTTTIKENVGKFITLNEEDYKPHPSRNQNEPGYYQIVGNLISHRNPDLYNFINIEQKILENSKRPINIWTLNEQGKKRVESAMDIVLKSNQKINYVDTLLLKMDQFDRKIVDFAQKSDFSKRQTTDAKIAKNVIAINNNICKYAALTGQKHTSFLNKDGKPYVEAHHLIPLKAKADFFPRSLDRPSNIVCLCPVCHELLHKGNLKDREKVLRVLYDHFIEGLNAEDFYISFEDLFNKYYK